MAKGPLRRIKVAQVFVRCVLKRILACIRGFVKSTCLGEYALSHHSAAGVGVRDDRWIQPRRDGEIRAELLDGIQPPQVRTVPTPASISGTSCLTAANTSRAAGVRSVSSITVTPPDSSALASDTSLGDGVHDQHNHQAGLFNAFVDRLARSAYTLFPVFYRNYLIICFRREAEGFLARQGKGKKVHRRIFLWRALSSTRKNFRKPR